MSNAAGRVVSVKSEPAVVPVGAGRPVQCALCGAAGAGAGVLPPAQHERGVELIARLQALAPHAPLPAALCRGCAAHAHQAFAFQQKVAGRVERVGVGAGAEAAGEGLGARVRALRRRLHELTQHVDVFVVVGGGGAGAGAAGGAYTEDNIIAVERALLAAALDRQSPPPAAGAALHQCALCPLSFATESEVLEHGRAHEVGAQEEGHWCWQCGARCDSVGQLRAHEAAAHAHDALAPASPEGEQPHPDRVCYLCCNVFEEESSVWEHACSSGWACPAAACGVRARSRAHLARHVHAAHSLRPTPAAPALPGSTQRVCAVCWRVLEDVPALRDHMRMHSRSRTTPCAHQACPLRFHTREEMVEHVKAWHAGARAGGVPCVQCARVFDSARALNAHRRAAHPPLSASPALPLPAKQEMQSDGEAEGEGEAQEVQLEGDGEGEERRVVYVEAAGAGVLLLGEGDGQEEGEGEEVGDVEYLELEALEDDADSDVSYAHALAHT